MRAVAGVEDAKDVCTGLERVGRQRQARGGVGHGKRRTVEVSVENQLGRAGWSRSSRRDRRCDGDCSSLRNHSGSHPDGGRARLGRGAKGKGRRRRDGGLVVGIARVDSSDQVGARSDRDVRRGDTRNAG